MTSSYERSFITVTGFKFKIYHLSIAKKKFLMRQFYPGIAKEEL